MTDQQELREFGEAFAKCVKQSGEVYQPIRIEAPIGNHSPDAPAIDLKELRQFGEPMSPPEGPTMAEVRKHYEEQRRFFAATSHPLPVPIEQLVEWRERINEIRREVNAHGLHFEAVISHHGPSGPTDPAILYGKPLAWSDNQKMIEELARAARDPSKIVKVEAKVMSGTRTVIEVEVITP